MKEIRVLIVLSMLTLVACSGGSNNESTENISDIESSTEALEVDDLDVDNAVNESNVSNAQSDESAKMDTMPADIAPTETTAMDKNININDMAEYIIQSGDTLMLIAFKLYGDYTKWKDLEQMNQVNQTGLIVGKTIKYAVPAQAFSWQPSGNPHLIVRGETLGIISEKYYNTKSKWKNIWENNRPMIKNPDLIFAGFTVYYPDLANLASL